MDEIGDLDDAISVAAERAGLGEGDYGVRYIQREPSLSERLAMSMVSAGHRLLQWTGIEIGPALGAGTLSRLVARLDAELRSLAGFNDPRNLYYHCFCELL